MVLWAAILSQHRAEPESRAWKTKLSSYLEGEGADEGEHLKLSVT